MKFKYRTIEKGKTETGTLESDSEDKVISHLKSQGKTVLEVTAVPESIIDVIKKQFSRVTFTDVVDFTRKISMMLNAGLTIVESLSILKQQTSKPAALKLIADIDTSVREGASFSTALSAYRGVFNNLYISLVKAGEASGKLDEILLKLADNLEKQREFRAKLKGALVYPALVICAMLIVMFVMITFVVPQLLGLYKDFNIDLPITTQLLIAISDFFQKFWILIIIVVFVGISSFKKYISTKKGKLMFDKFILNVPIIKNVITMAALVDATKTLSILIESGVSILEGLSIVIETTNNMVFQNAFTKVRDDVEHGLSLGKAMEQTDVFPPIIVQMTYVGEQTGKLDDTLARISKYFEMESEMAIKAMTSLIEPGILLVLAVGVGFIVISVITPIYNLTSAF